MRFFTLLVTVFFLLSSQVWAGYKIVLQEGNTLLDLYIDNHGSVEIVGLPVDDRFVYDISSGRFYIQPSHTDKSYYVSTAELEDKVVMGDIVSPLFSPEGMMFGFDTRRWNASIYDEYCHAIDGSHQMTTLTGLSHRDMKRIGLAVGYVLAQDMKGEKCSYHKVSPAVASLIGFPMRIYETKEGVETKVVSFVEDPTLELIKVPENATYLDDDAYIGFLKRRLNYLALSSFLKTEKQLSSSRLKVKALQRLLSFPENRAGFDIPEVNAGNVYGGKRSESQTLKRLD